MSSWIGMVPNRRNTHSYCNLILLNFRNMRVNYPLFWLCKLTPSGNGRKLVMLSSLWMLPHLCSNLFCLAIVRRSGNKLHCQTSVLGLLPILISLLCLLATVWYSPATCSINHFISFGIPVRFWQTKCTLTIRYLKIL